MRATVVRRAGAASLDLAYVGAGAFDGYFELGLGLWDIAAGALLVREAGGVVTDWAGDPGAARSIWEAVIELYGDRSWAAAAVERARAALADVPRAPTE